MLAGDDVTHSRSAFHSVLVDRSFTLSAARVRYSQLVRTYHELGKLKIEIMINPVKHIIIGG